MHVFVHLATLNLELSDEVCSSLWTWLSVRAGIFVLLQFMSLACSSISTVALMTSDTRRSSADLAE